MKKRPSLSVASELDALACAVDAARLIAEYLDTEQLATAEEVAQAPRLVVALLNLAGARLRTLLRVTRGSADPASLLAEHNVAFEGEEGLVIKAWPRPPPSTERTKS